MKLPIAERSPRQAEFSSPLHQFCRMMVDKYQNPNHISADMLAGEFRKILGLPEYLCLEDIKEVCSSAGIATEARELSSELKGLNFAYDGKLLIVYEDSMWQGSQLISLLHELRELMCNIFIEVNPSIPIPRRLEPLSEAFAAAVAMQETVFRKDATRSFFNPISLQRQYGQSYHFVLYRMIKVFNETIPMSVSMFQNTKLLAVRKGRRCLQGFACEGKETEVKGSVYYSEGMMR